MDIEPEISNNKNRTSVIDMIASDPKTGEIVLVMNEPNEWDGSDEQLLALQERFNAYVSFLLDGEMAEAHPKLAGKPARIELRCARMPDTGTLGCSAQFMTSWRFRKLSWKSLSEMTNDQ
jgi:hypothetical protein